MEMEVKSPTHPFRREYAVFPDLKYPPPCTPPRKISTPLKVVISEHQDSAIDFL